MMQSPTHKDAANRDATASLPLARQIGYASGNMAKALQWGAVDFLYLYFLINVIGMPAQLAGAVIFASLIFDALTDPIVARFVDKHRAKIGTYSRMLRFAAPISALCFLLLFTIPMLDLLPKPVLAIIASLLFRLGYTLVDIPHNALLASITSDPHTRTSLAAWRYFFSSVSTIILSSSVGVLEVASIEGGIDLIRLLIIFAVAYWIVIFISAWSSDRGLSSISPIKTQRFSNSAFKALTNNKRFIAALILITCATCFFGVLGKIAVFLPELLEIHDFDGGRLLFLFGCGKITSFAFWVVISKRFGKWRAAYSGFIICAMVPLFLFLPGIDMGARASALYYVYGFGIGGAITLTWSIMADAVDENERISGHRFEAFSFGIFLLVIKSSSGLGTFLTSSLISVYTSQAASFQPPNLALILGIVCGTSGLIAMATLHKTKIHLQ